MISTRMNELRIAVNKYRGVLYVSRACSAVTYTRNPEFNAAVCINHDTYPHVSHIFRSVSFLNVCGYTQDHKEWVIKSITAISERSTTWDCKKWLYIYASWFNTIYD